MRGVIGLLLSAVLVAASTVSAAEPADWKTANKAMGAAVAAGDARAAAGHARAALAAYRASPSPSEKTLLNLALNVAELAVGSDSDLLAASDALNSLVADFAAKGASTANSRIYLHTALAEIAKSRRMWSKSTNELANVVRAAREGYGPGHVQVAMAEVALARSLQLQGVIGRAAESVRAARTIVATLPADDVGRLSTERLLALYDIEGRRYREARQQLEALMPRLSPNDPKHKGVWSLAAANLSVAQARGGDRKAADATMAALIAGTKDNPEPTPLILWAAADYVDMSFDTVTEAIVTFDIGPDGRPTNIKAEATRGNPQFATAASKALADSRYLPVIRNGVPETTAGRSIRFRTAAEREPTTGTRLID
jgi:hypothetical protein